VFQVQLRVSANIFMTELTGNLLVAQSGGPTAVINASLAGVIQEAGRHECIEEIYGGLNGILGILNEDWPDRLPGPELGDYAGLPVNDAVRARADAWDASLITLPEYQCRVHPSDYVSSFAGLRIWEERDSASQQLIAIHTHHFAWGTERTIWMDGRPHPPEYAAHTYQGFSTGTFEGNMLTTFTDHVKIKFGEPSTKGGIVHATFEGARTKGTIELTPTKGDCIINPVTQVKGVGEFTLK